LILLFVKFGTLDRRRIARREGRGPSFDEVRLATCVDFDHDPNPIVFLGNKTVVQRSSKWRNRCMEIRVSTIICLIFDPKVEKRERLGGLIRSYTDAGLSWFCLRLMCLEAYGGLLISDQESI
jgi:hypothetical protein